MKKILFVPIIFLGINLSTFAQGAIIAGQDSTRNVITTAVPFLTIGPDARASGMGDAGGALSPDINATYWNPAKLVFVEGDMGFSFSYSPWLSKIINDMGLYYLNGYKKLDQNNTLGASLKYFDLGDIPLATDDGTESGTFSPREFAIDVVYSRKLNEGRGVGASFRFIHSNLSGNFTNSAFDTKPGTSVAVDIGYYNNKEITFLKKPTDWIFAAAITNIGSKMTYTNDNNRDWLPTNLRVGTSFGIEIDPYNKFTFAVDLNKLMVPTPPIYERDSNGNIIFDPNTGDPIIREGKDPNRGLLSGMFGSFADAPGGFSEEMKEFQIAFGMEYAYRNAFFARTGYFYENEMKGNRRYFTLGLGLEYQKFGIDFSYLIPTIQNHPLAETLRFTLQYNFDEKEDTDND
ncbi:type IX secretion system outer membrane channel protein PorV [Mangrovivirga cuniculi]|uniref:Type IX secretion system protein PorV domain-containing protein n=1 Tax=Mangrovivirga cuniculi TaxID=2715131 RepID=A0A4D7JRG0_9BACT|nr:type IX secretion system outer membrane channel protein PorV [Mangrovivirga cuniculi]QCK14336.1 hypothetical protein DCC35_06050 [Mangrovivirga cuniculi]